MQTVTVIGGTGFVGDYLVKLLAGKPDIKTRAVFKTTPPANTRESTEYVQMDCASDINQLKKVLMETDYLVILSRPNRKLIQNIINSNYQFKKILYASTILIYPDSEEKQPETSNVIPASLYEEQKIEEEEMLTIYAKDSGNKLTIARLTNVYGDIKNRALVHWIMSAAVNNAEFKLNNEGRAVRDFIFVEDAAKYLLTLLFLKQESDIEVFNVCTGEGTSINQVIDIVEEISGKKIKLTQGDHTDQKYKVIGDNRKIVMVTGIKPEYNLKLGLEKTYSNYIKSI